MDAPQIMINKDVVRGMGIPDYSKCIHLKGASSMSIYITIPYFYIIQHITSGKKYAGSKYGRKSNPMTFLTELGYKTSSKIVNQLIRDEGIIAFKIIQLLTEHECGMNVYEYETMFLQTNDCAKSDMWLNCHNNHKISYHDDNYKQLMIKKFGVVNPMQSKEIQETFKIRYLEKHGIEWPVLSEKVRKSNSIRMIGNSLSINTTLWNDGKKTYRITENEIPKKSWVRGMLIGNNNEWSKNSTWWNNGIKSQQFKIDDIIPDGWTKGMVKRKS